MDASAEIFFGYRPVPSGVEIYSLPAAVRIPNALALSDAVFFVAFVPWILRLIFCALVYDAYPKDARKLRKTVGQRKKVIEKE